MNNSRKLIKKTKRKFIIFTLIGISIVLFISFVSLNFYSETISKQASMQDLNVRLGGHFNLINKISALARKYDYVEGQQEIQKLEAELALLSERLNYERNLLTNWVQKNNQKNIDVVERYIKKDQILERVKYYIDQSLAVILDKKKQEQKSKIMQFLSEGTSTGVGKSLGLILDKLESEQKQSFDQLYKMGFLLVALCILQVILVWLLVFKPLYTTIMIQHEKISGALLSAKSASRSKTEFLANISHEIRTPMTAILGYADILKRNNLSLDDKNDAIKIINQNAQHLLGLIDEILDISKIEAGKFEFENEEVNLSTLLNEVYSLIHVKSDSKGIDLIFKNKGKIPETIMADPKRLKQILFNILGNAIKFTEKGYVELVVSYKEELNHLVICIKDTGCGIPKDQQKKLFRPFEQADASVSREHGGTGLGLVLSKGLAQGMKGDINIVESKVGVGTTFEIILNVGKVQSQNMLSQFSTNIIDEAESSPENSMLKAARILVVDDAKENARLFKMYLAEAGADVQIANDGQKALSLAESQYFDLILLDLQMPGKDGFQVIKELRDKAFNRPVVALTAHAMKEEKEKTKEAGFNDHITKPVKPDEFIQKVSSLI